MFIEESKRVGRFFSMIVDSCEEVCPVRQYPTNESNAFRKSLPTIVRIRTGLWVRDSFAIHR